MAGLICHITMSFILINGGLKSKNIAKTGLLFNFIYLCKYFFVQEMKKQLKHIISEFIQKMRFKYRVSITNENTLEETWFTRLSRVSVLLYASGFFLFTFILLTLIIFTTPLRLYLPGYEDSGNRTAIVQQSMRTDSIQNELELMNAYIETLKSSIQQTNQQELEVSLDSVTMKERAVELMRKSKQEDEFVKKYEETEKFNLGAINTGAPIDNTYVFFKPVNGVVASTYNPREGKYGVSIITPPGETVKTVLEGKIIFSGFTFENNWVIQVQHDNDYVSIYKNNNRLLKQVGDYVKTGQSIAITGAEGEIGKSKHFYFEIWKKGLTINPQDVITFRY